MSVTLHKKTFQELSTDELYELLRVRSEVFVVEQNCVYQDLDYDICQCARELLQSYWQQTSVRTHGNGERFVLSRAESGH